MDALSNQKILKGIYSLYPRYVLCKQYLRAKKKSLQGVKTMQSLSWLDHKSKILVVDE